MPGFPVHHQLPEFTQTHVHRVGDAIQPSHPQLSPSPPAPNPSQHQSLFQWVNSSHEVAKVLEFQLSIIPSKEISGRISFRMDWLDLLAVQGTLKSLLQYHSSKASILWCSACFTVQLSHPYMTTGKTIALTRRTLHTYAHTMLHIYTVYTYGYKVCVHKYTIHAYIQIPIHTVHYILFRKILYTEIIFIPYIYRKIIQTLYKQIIYIKSESVRRSVVSDSMGPHGL